MDATFARNPTASPDPSAEQVAQMLDVVAAGNVQAAINGLEGLLAHLRPALAARDELAHHVPSKLLKAALELRRRRAGST